jgi:hypothetical protein
MTVEISPIADADVLAVADFLHANLNDQAPWARSCWAMPWRTDAPNHGFLLRDGQLVVGACVAFYSERLVAGRVERFCNVGAWSVLPAYRFHSVRLLTALLAQEGYHFTALSGNATALAIFARFKFRSLDTSAALIPNLPWPAVPGRTRISGDPDVIESSLTGTELGLYRDHAHALAVHHHVLLRGRESCYIMYREFRHRDVPLYAVLLDLLRIAQEAISNALRHAKPTMISVLLKGDLSLVTLEVRDNGSGIDRVRLENEEGLGIASMRDRAKQLDAELDIRTAPGRGTAVTVRLPLRGER